MATKKQTKAKLRPYLFISDAHRPYHDERAWRLVIEVGKDLKPYGIVCIGDFADFYSVSSHSKDPARRASLAEELMEVHSGLNDLDSLGAADKHYIGGNHEDRLTRYLRDKAPELFGVTDIPSVLNLGGRGWNYTPYKEYTKRGKLHMTHDVGTAGRYATFKALDTFQHSIITGHAHRLQYVVEGNAVGEYKLSAQFGWLGDRTQIDYMHQARVNKDWALGFGFGYVDGNSGIAYLTPVPIIVNDAGVYTCVVNGKFYTN